MSSVLQLDTLIKQSREALLAALTLRYESPWFRRYLSDCGLASLELLLRPRSGTLYLVVLLSHLRWDGVKKDQAVDLMQVLIGAGAFRVRKGWERIVDKIYSGEFDSNLSRLLQQSRDMLLVADDPRFCRLPKSAVWVYAAAKRIQERKKSLSATLSTSYVELSIEAGVSRITTFRAVKILQEAGIIRWYPGHKSSPSLLEFLSPGVV